MNITLVLPDKAYRHTVIILLRKELEKHEDTEFLIDWIEDMWATIDTLVDRFGQEDAQKIIQARLGIIDFIAGN